MEEPKLPPTMQAIRIHPSAQPDKPYSSENPPPISSLNLDTIPIPEPLEPNDILVRVHATTIIKDTLTWPELSSRPYMIPGHDFAGTVVRLSSSSSSASSSSSSHNFHVGDHVYGMVHADRGACWAEYVIVKAGECALKPESLSWEVAASIPLSALTAWQALFVKAELDVLRLEQIVNSDRWERQSHGSCVVDAHGQKVPKLLILGASGGVGLWLVQLARLAGCFVVAGTSSKARSQDILGELGADEIVEYPELSTKKFNRRFDIIIDALGGSLLEQSWHLVKENGYLISIESAAWDFVQQHRQSGIAKGREDVKALFFIVEPSDRDLSQLSEIIEAGKLKTFVTERFPIAEVRTAYELSHGSSRGKGKVVLLP